MNLHNQGASGCPGNRIKLILSPRTVSTRLYPIYPKINVKSRSELTRVIMSSEAG